ncbi:precorrin-6A synthase (deacetylating) [Cereibacter azotoformans]|uniref:Precorrin-6A synthase [deacetylating] n=1 Tax=Cereibacter azotoformans TaxID=43057 RepID=A0A2T5KD31_9RHOB|nr:precorrin-6A synthase (deacetylating) [Cereibacter azotoformans]AXQ93555.1 precorrin-6A synthase (deacetylating) [Cereibacter sphaeroides]MBO4168678.1 precorrin-6A synthase (deacetylating) [Cereibacter azotoformans]PTR20330.1 precorrin-6A synthase (deacetylating) [Cereibacter azotoformans]UIJ31893.1 precorrin-6A synthase (deacetylating) [Cereibacter azotoformans]
MMDLILIGIGTGNPDHVTLEGRRAMAEADLILVPRKGEDKADLAGLRLAILAEAAPHVPVAEFDLPVRDAAHPDYRQAVEDWHDAIALAWAQAAGQAARVALLIWGDPSLYDSSLRIAARLQPAPRVRVVPGITAIQALCAAHAIPLNEVGAPVLITTGRRLREGGWPEGVDRLAVMLDGETSFRHLPPDGVRIWWGAFLGMTEQILEAGPLAEAGPRIVATRAAARARHGWIMDIYLLARGESG